MQINEWPMPVVVRDGRSPNASCIGDEPNAGSEPAKARAKYRLSLVQPVVLTDGVPVPAACTFRVVRLLYL